MHIGIPTQQVARGLLGFVDAAGLDQIDNGIGSLVECIGLGGFGPEPRAVILDAGIELGALSVEFDAPGREHGVLGGLVLLQAPLLVLPATAAGAGIVATDLRHSGRALTGAGGAVMDTALLADPQLYALLQRCDEDLAAAQRAAGCRRCGSKLHWGCYPRKPRGVPRGWIAGYGRRLSLC
jgi:hypothetical protein